MPWGALILLLKSSDQFSAARLPLQVQSHVLNTSLQAHAHEFVEIALVLAGRSRHRTALGEGELRAGSLILLRPGAWHAFEEPKNLSVVNCLFGPELLRRELSPALEDPALRVALAAPLGVRGGEGTAANVLLLDLEAGARRSCLGHLRAIEILQDEPSTPASALARLGHLSLFLSLLARSLEVPDLLRARFPSGHPAVREAVALLESDSARPWTLAEMGRAVHLNPRYLVAVFKRDTGLAPMEYAQRLRLEHAANLLAESDEPIFRVAQRAGIGDANLFARRFRARFGCTPSQYRTRFRSG